MKKFLLYTLLVLSLSACGKKTGVPELQPATIPTTTPTTTATGSLSGTISPAGAVKSITVVSANGSKSYLIYADAVTGAFSLADVPEGACTLTFAIDAHFTAIASVNTVIAIGKNTDLGTLTTKETNFSISYNINGVFEGWLFKAYYPSSSLFSIGPLSTSTYPEDTRTVYYPAITLSGVTAPGTYTCKGSTQSRITYSGYRLGSGFRISYQSTEYAGGEGTVTITSIDSSNRVIKGTFTATLTSASGNSADTKIFTSGIINASY